ncbi:hypothetical protein CASFOL_022843 [Castilleja foliolosa]|uniref:Uncharacterized protein n=1 Tax=Castilleja foliolosa TaxID=1961234 RepID=A0ABD3CVJ2_9LAMI
MTIPFHNQKNHVQVLMLRGDGNLQIYLDRMTIPFHIQKVQLGGNVQEE